MTPEISFITKSPAFWTMGILSLVYSSAACSFCIIDNLSVPAHSAFSFGRVSANCQDWNAFEGFLSAPLTSILLWRCLPLFQDHPHASGGSLLAPLLACSVFRMETYEKEPLVSADLLSGWVFLKLYLPIVIRSSLKFQLIPSSLLHLLAFHQKWEQACVSSLLRKACHFLDSTKVLCLFSSLVD